jgi:hypothetical protein
MDNAPADPTLRLLPLDENTTDLVIRISSGKEIRYYGGSPSVEAEYSVIHGLDLSAGSITCIVGVGLGYTVQAVLNKMTLGHHVLVLEPNPGILKSALHQVDVADAINSGDLYITEPDQKAIEDFFIDLLSRGVISNNLRIIVDPRSQGLGDEYTIGSKRIEEGFRYATTMVGNAALVGRSSIQNEIENTIVVSLSPGLDTLKPQMKGKPVLLVGAGPSLDQSIEKIYRAQEKMYVLSFAASWKSLLTNGLSADFILSSDKNVQSVAALKHTRFAQKIPLIFSSSCHPHFIKNFTGPRIVAPQKAFYPLLPSHNNHEVALTTGTSVAVFAFNVAVYLEADPIVFIGLDLAVDKVTHASGHHFSGEFDPDDPRLKRVVGVKNTSIQSFPYLLDIKRHLEWRIHSSGQTPLNASLSGARIHGTLEMDLDDVCKTLPSLSKGYYSAIPLTAERVRDKLPFSDMNKLSEDVKKLQGICASGIRASEAFKKKLNKGQKDAALAGRINQAGEALQELMVKTPLLNQYFSSIWLDLKRETQKSASITDLEKRLNAEAEKNLMALREMASEITGLMKKISRQQNEMAKIVQERGSGSLDGGFLS